MKTPHKFNYNWTLKDSIFTKDKGKVFSCFACGGGSTMGYKLAGFDVIGFNEIDPKMAECYIENHKPRYSFVEDIRIFKERNDLPEELYNLDILDGSPPCSSFSMAGNREKDWGKEKKFREGQAMQTLDDLFFDFIDLTRKLQPKIAIAENVSGILLGEAKKYVRKILSEFDKAGYVVKEISLNAMRMGVPQKRERVFFIAIRKDLVQHLPINDSILFDDFPFLDMVFFEPLINFGEFEDNQGKPLNKDKVTYQRWLQRIYGDKSFGDITERINGKGSDFNTSIIYSNEPFPTIVSKGCEVKFDLPIKVSDMEYCKAGSYPTDYNFLSNKPAYLIGMSVPPVMMAQIASRIYEQWRKIF